MKRNLGWHFVGATLRDGRPIPPDGVWLEHTDPLVMCESGLHFARSPWDALQYAPGDTLCLDEIGGTIIENIEGHKDKGVCSRRKIIVRLDATEMLLYFARMQALSVVHLWDAPDVMLDFLMTGDASIRRAAYSVADSVADSAAYSAARSAADSAAYSAACAAGVAYSVADSVADSAAYSAARSAASAADSAAGVAYSASRADFNALVYECFEAWL